jgi:hypothetical protein
VSLVDTLANGCTVLAVALCPAIGLPASFSLGDIFLVLALMLRGIQLITTGLDLHELRNHDFLLGVFAAIILGGLAGGIVNGYPLDILWIRMILATFGTLLAVAFYGSTRERLKTLVRAIALGCTFLAISGSLRPTTDGRWYGYSIHPNLYAHSIVMGLMACVACFFWTRDPRARVLWAACGATSLVGIWESGSRGALLGVGVSLLLFVALSGRRWLVYLALAFTYVTLIVIVAGAIDVGGNSALGRLLDGSKDVTVQGSNNERSESFAHDIDVITAKPIFGESFITSVGVHVVYLQAWTAAGLIGFIAVAILGIYMFVLPFGRPRAVLALPCGVAGVAAMWFFTNIFGTRDQWFFIILAFRMARTPPARPAVDDASDQGLPASAGASK